MIIIIVGIPGSGKSTVLNAVEEACPFIKVVGFGPMMHEEAGLHGIGRDEMRKMPFEKQQKLGIEVAKRIAKEAKGLILVDTHACIKTPLGFCPGLPLPVLNELKPKALVMIDCAPSLIVERRILDKSRSRDEESLEELTLHKELTREYLTACSTLTGALVCIIENGKRPVLDNALPLVHLIQALHKQ